ncbi:MAG: hypothetical protein HRU29_11940 [Rhizobiales bacterium]|nr:hypothetical protein [Hyphomicrobiales bacterium]NRB15100.1 hypothetical protein [Hyphomicrobiales bacterium]
MHKFKNPSGGLRPGVINLRFIPVLKSTGAHHIFHFDLVKFISPSRRLASFQTGATFESCVNWQLNIMGENMTLSDEKLFNGVIEWQDITIEIDQHVIHADVGITGISVKSLIPKNEPLPITETGFRSIFPSLESVEYYGGVENYVVSYLNHEASKPEWERTKKRLQHEQIEQSKIDDASKQIDMFGGVL